MRKFRISYLIPLALAQSALAAPVCPAGTSPSEVRQGNTRVLSCLDAQGRPHGPFEVLAFADSTLAGFGVLVVEGWFHHGMREDEWTTFGRDGKAVEKSRFEEGREVEDEDDSE